MKPIAKLCDVAFNEAFNGKFNVYIREGINTSNTAFLNKKPRGGVGPY
jgi:hypothetical protein